MENMNKTLNSVKNCLFLAGKKALKAALKRRVIFVLSIIIGFLFGFLPFSHQVKDAQNELAMAESKSNNSESTSFFPILQENTLFPLSFPSDSGQNAVKELRVVVTAYSSSPWETDDTPFITASGKWVKNGIVANNLLPFGTKIRMPELYGDQIFIVEDRMHQRKGYYHVDIWFPCYWEAKNFGAKITYIEILES